MRQAAVGSLSKLYQTHFRGRYYGYRVCCKRTKTMPCPSVRLSVPGAAAGDAHRRLHMTRGRRKFWSDCKEVQNTC